jgi:hypothetical protein
MLLFARECPFVIDGALVLSGIAVAAKAAEMALALHRLTGAVVSRRGTCAKASAACIEEYNGRPLVAGSQRSGLVSCHLAGMTAQGTGPGLAALARGVQRLLL